MSDLSLSDRVAPSDSWRQYKDGSLNIRREQIQVHDLRDACASDMARAGELSVIRNNTIAQVAIELDRQRHESCDARDAAHGLRLGLRLLWLASSR